jgi:hypothetical protein
MTPVSVATIVAIIGVIITLPPSALILWRLFRGNREALNDLEMIE